MHTHRVLLLAALPFVLHTAFSQTLGKPQVFNIQPRTKCDYYTRPIVLDHQAIILGTPSKMDKDDPRTVLIQVPLDGSVAPTEQLFKLPTVPNKHIFTQYFSFSGHPNTLLQSWDKETGIVDLYVQQYDEAFIADGTPVKVGSVPLDTRTYHGSPLAIREIVSPDGTKLLIYFDGIQSNDIKIAMCWVLDKAFNPIWNRSYRLPVQAYGAGTDAILYDSGAVSVDVVAVVLDEDNTKEKKDGTIAAKVDKTFYGNTTTTLYVLHDELFASLDAKALGGEKMQDGELLHTSDGWIFVAMIAEGKGKNTEVEQVIGSFGPEGVIVKSRTQLPLGTRGGVRVDTQGAFIVIWRDEGDLLSVTKFDEQGNQLWKHSAPYPSWPPSIVNGRLFDFARASEDAVANLEKNEPARMNDYLNSDFHLLTIWNDGNRTVMNLTPGATSNKEKMITIYERTLTESGFFYRGRDQVEPSLTFLPLIW